jgi:hypothetical protein
LFKDITQLNNQKKQADSTYHELQIWCADMWSVLWNGWKRGHQTVCHPNMEFSWATSSIEDYKRYNIFHNAGITTNTTRQFYKADYMERFPYNLNLDIAPDTATRAYYEHIQSVGRRSVLL